MTIEYARTVLNAEIAAIESVRGRLGPPFKAAVETILSAPGRVVACGIGKAGIIAQKVAATMASTGTEAIFLHPADALHGDLGITRAGDVALLFSNSGESDEIVRLLPSFRRLGLATVAVTGSARSTLGVQADTVLLLGDLQEACPLGLAPTASTTAMLALGDALAMTLMRERGFSATEYAAYHPAGELGRKALTVADVMRGREAVALVAPGRTVGETLAAITEARSGAAVVVGADGRLVGIFTDGDLRRGLAGCGELLSRPVDEAMTRDPQTVRCDAPAAEAFAVLREHRIGEIPVLDGDGVVVGLVDLKSLVAEGLA